MTAAFERAVARFRDDAEMRRFDTTEDVGGCWASAHRFAWHLHEKGVPYAFRRFHDLPERRTTHHHVLEVEGHGVDWAYRQRDAAAEWPHI